MVALLKEGVSEQTGWQAQLHLGFRKTPSRTVLAERQRKGPLSVQRALYPERDLCHVYLLHPPGGVAGGDELDIKVRVASQASALVTTPGATKFYRSVGPVSRQAQCLSVEDGTLEWLPQENIFFPNTLSELHTRIDLSGNAGFIGWEINCLGRPVVGEQFKQGRAVFRFGLYRDGLPLLLERLHVEGEKTLQGPAGLRGQPVIGSLYATLDDKSVVADIRDSLDIYSDDLLAITVVDGIFVARYLGQSTERARNYFIKIWRQLRRPVIGREPCPPRIWNT